jgi:hypothetical protein
MRVLALVAAVGALVGAGPALPGPDSPIPAGPETLAGRLAATEEHLGAAVQAWVRTGELDRPAPPEDVTLGGGQRRLSGPGRS